MRKEDWAGVFPAITTPFHDDHSIDEESLASHVTWMLDSGCRGIVPLGSLGEAATLSFDEKVRVMEVCREAIGDRGFLAPGLSGLSTAECVALARRAEEVGCDGIMVLPAYVHKGDWAETRYHYSSVIDATGLSCMLYNNPIAYQTDVLPEQVAIFADEHENLHSLKESSGDIRRIASIRALIDDRLAIFVGIDDIIVESIRMGATGWIAGLVNALPEESVKLFDLAVEGKTEETRELYEWFLPLLKLDLGPKFVQKIKLAQAEVGRGTPTVRPPRLELQGDELQETLETIRDRLGSGAPDIRTVAAEQVVMS